MNRVFNIVWNRVLSAWVVASEHATSRGKRGASAKRAAGALALGIATFPAHALATDLPTGGTVVLGSGTISSSTSDMVIDQASSKLAINWQSFDIGTGNSVTFNQPSSSSIALNRVLGSDGSSILGQLNANGRVFLINPNGILFGSGASVNVGALVASTLNITDEDFAAGTYSFKGDGANASVINKGSISAADGGAVALLGGTVSNQGTIVANLGTVALAAGNAVTLDFAGDGLLSVQVDEATKDALVENQQLIQADGGSVIMTAKASDALLQTVVNNTGVIEARTLGEKNGKIVLLGGDSGTVEVAGTLDASAPDGGDGGFVETSGAHVKVADGATVTTLAASGTTGEWLIDPTDFTIYSGAGDQTDSGIGADTLSDNLATTSVTLETVDTGSEDGDINVDAAVSWDADTTLTLDADNDINVNAAITANGASAGLVLNYGGDYNVNAAITFSNDSNTDGLSINGTAYTLIHSMAALDAIDSTGLSGDYALAEDLDASGTTYTSALVGTSSSAFTGTFAGLGHTISELTIDAGSTNYIGLFGYTGSGSVIRDIGLLGGSVTTTGSSVGGLVGFNDSGSISNAYATGSVNGSDYVGGLVGRNYYGSISNAYASGSVNGSSGVGGLVGYNVYGSISNAYATGSVTGSDYVGGLVGRSTGSISNAYATGSVTGSEDVGGLVGRSTGSISNAYWDSDSSGQSTAVGGGTVTNVSSVTSNTRYSAGSYSSLGTWTCTSGLCVAYDSSGNANWIMIEGQTRPFLASEYSTTIRNAHQLQLMAYDLSASYTLATDIDASQTDGEDDSGLWSSAGFDPIGDDSAQFTGSLDGQSYTISGLTFNRSDTESYVGLFGYVGSSGSIANLGLEGGSVNGGYYYIGSLAGYSAGTISGVQADVGVNVTGATWYGGGLVGYNAGNISDSDASGEVQAVGASKEYGSQYLGGLVGNNTGSIQDSYASGNVSGEYDVGGLVGGNSGSIAASYASGDVTGITDDSGGNSIGGLAGANTNGSISDSYATGTVSGNSSVGGLVGYNFGYNGAASIEDSYATGSVTGNDDVGGLAGSNLASVGTASIGTSYASGNVTGGTSMDGEIGGLVGENSGTVENSYASGDVSGRGDIGGLVGYNNDGTVQDSYALGTASGDGVIGGLVGWNGGTVENSFYAITDASGADITAGLSEDDIALAGTPKTHAELTDLSTFTDAGWDIDDEGGTGLTWRIYAGNTTPLLRSFLTTLTVTGTPDYDGSGTALSNIASVTWGNIEADSSHLFGSSTSTDGDTLTLGSTADGEYTATSNASSGALYSDQQGYDIVYGTASRSISTSGSTAGDIQLPSSITWSSGALVIDTSGSLTTGTTGTLTTVIDGDVFRLQSGSWLQNAEGDTLADFSVNDFGLDTTNATFLRVLDGDGSADDPYQIADVYGLQGIASTSLLGDSYLLANDIDASGTANWNCDDSDSCEGFDPIGDNSAQFTGSLDGQDHVISGLTIDRADTDYVGLFGYAGSGSSISDLALENVSITASGDSVYDGVPTGAYVGALAGYSRATLANVSASGSVGGVYDVGGLVGHQDGGSISDSHADVAVTGLGNAVDNGDGRSWDFSNIGGLVGYSRNSEISNSYASGDVTTTDLNTYSSVGGLVGDLTSSTGGSSISGSYASGDVSVSDGSSYVGGLVGIIAAFASTVTNSYATGDVQGGGASAVGGLVGTNNGSIANSYATGAVGSGSSQVGGLVGNHAYGSITASFYATTDADGNDINSGLSLFGNSNATVDSISGGRTWTQLTDIDTFTTDITNAGGTAWDIDDEGGTGLTWRIYAGSTTPLLRSFLTAVTVSTASASKTYDGTVATGSLNDYSATLADDSSADSSLIAGTLNYATTSANAGSYTLADDTLSLYGLYSSQQGYDISYAGDTSYTIDKALATVTANSAIVTYNGQTQSVSGFSASGLVAGEDEDVLTGVTSSGGTGSNAGSYVHSVSGTDDNYSLTFIAGTLTINPASLTLSAVTDTKVYDGTTVSSGVVAVSGLIAGDTIDGLSQSFDSKDVLDASTLAVDGGYLIDDGNGGANYTVLTNTASGSITPASLTVTANNASKTYDGLAYSGGNGVSYSGFVNGEDESVLSGTLSYGGDAQGAVDADTYSLTASGLTASNYAISFDSGTLTINPASLTVTANNASKTYDGLAYSGGNGVSYSGFVNGEDESVLSGTLSYGGDAQGAVDADTYSLTASGLTASNYAISFDSGTLTINEQSDPAVQPESNSPSLPAAYADILASLSFARSEDQRRAEPTENPLPYQVIASGIHLPEGI